MGRLETARISHAVKRGGRENLLTEQCSGFPTKRECASDFQSQLVYKRRYTSWDKQHMHFNDKNAAIIWAIALITYRIYT